MSSNYYKVGSWNVICDRTGFKVKANNTRREWNNLIVRNESFETRHPQDYVKAVKDIQAVRFARPKSIVYLGANEVTVDNL